MNDLFNEFEVTEENFLIYAAKNYYNPRSIDAEEFFEDIHRFKYIKRLLNRYNNSGELMDRLILNHLIVIFNSFGYDAGIRMLAHKLEYRYWPILKPFLVFLKALTDDDLVGIEMDNIVVESLRKI